MPYLAVDPLTTVKPQTPQNSGPSPELFFRIANAYQQTAALKAAVELSVFTAIADGACSAAAIAKKCQTDERGMRILCDYLCVITLLAKENFNYELTPDSSMFLNRHSPAYMGGTLEFLLSPHLTAGFSDVAALVRHGGAVRSDGATLVPEHPVWVTFARAMMPMMAMPAELLAQRFEGEFVQPTKILDIAAGHGLFGIAFAKSNPNVTVTAQDWANVLEVAQENAQSAGVANRYSTLPGDAFQVEFGDKYDIVLLTNFLHHFDPQTCERLLKKVHASLTEDGRAVSLEFIPNEDRISPPMPATFSLMMLGETPGGDAYTRREYETMFRNAGFSSSEFHQLPSSPQQIVISSK